MHALLPRGRELTKTLNSSLFDILSELHFRVWSGRACHLIATSILVFGHQALAVAMSVAVEEDDDKTAVPEVGPEDSGLDENLEGDEESDFEEGKHECRPGGLCGCASSSLEAHIPNYTLDFHAIR
jgi:hypothetical protein